MEATRISYGAKSLPPTAFGRASFYTQLLGLVHLLSRCYAPAAYPEHHRQNTTAISRTVDAHARAVIPGYLSCRHKQAQVV